MGRWREYLKDLLNPSDTLSTEKEQSGNSEVGSSLSGAEVAPGMDEIHPQFLKTLDVVELFWLTHRTVPLQWQTGVAVPLFLVV